MVVQDGGMGKKRLAKIAVQVEKKAAFFVGYSIALTPANAKEKICVKFKKS